MQSSESTIARQILQNMPVIMPALAAEQRGRNRWATPSHLGVLAALARGQVILSRLCEATLAIEFSEVKK